MKTFIAITAFFAIALSAVAWPPPCPDGNCPNPTFAVRSKVAPATLIFDVSPPDGELWIGGQKFDTHRVTTNPVATARYRAVVKWHRGGQWIERQVETPTFAGGDTVRVKVRLEPPPPPASGNDTAPIELIEGATVDKGGTNFGIQIEQLEAGGPMVEAFSVNGQAVGRVQAKQTLAGQLPDDRKLLRLTVIGSKDFTAPIMEDLAKPPLKDIRDQMLVQTYTPAAWAVKDAGFKGGSQIYVETPDGKVLHRQETYRGPEKLNAALRKAEASYRPERDPDLNGNSDSVTLIVLLAAAAFAVFNL